MCCYTLSLFAMRGCKRVLCERCKTRMRPNQKNGYLCRRFQISITMKHLNTVIAILLNVLFCALLLWFFTRNAFLRPYAGSPSKEAFAALLLLGSLYANYFLFYPKLYRKHSHSVYWLLLVFTALATGFLDLAIAYKNISLCCAKVIESVGFISFFSKRLFLIVGRNFAFNLFPFLFRDRQHFQQALEKEVEVVYQDVRKVDVFGDDKKIHLIVIDDIFYCRQQRNFTEIFVVQQKKYTRVGSLKYLEQLFGEDFVRITTTELLPFRYIKSCESDTVVMKQMPWESEPTTFTLEAKNRQETFEKVTKGLQRNKTAASGKKVRRRPSRTKGRRNPIKPSDDKVKEVLAYIETHSGCNSGDIVRETGVSLSSVERCVALLKKQGLVEHTGSRKHGGYAIVLPKQKTEGTEVQKEGDLQKMLKGKSANRKPVEPSSE